MKRAQSRPKIVRKVEDLGGVAFDDVTILHANHEQHITPPEPQCLRGLLGDDFFREICLVGFGCTDLNDEQLADLSEVTGIEWVECLTLGGTKITDAGLVNLKRWASLRSLLLQNTMITDAGLNDLKRLSGLTYLDISGTQTTDKAVEDLKQALPKCKIIH